MAGLARKHPFIKGIVGGLDLTQDEDKLRHQIREQGSTKLLYLLSEIIETPKSGRNFFLETTGKKFKQVYRWQSCFYHRKLFPSQKIVSVTETSSV